MALVVVLAGGGSAGHVVPALALAEAIQKSDPETQIRFVLDHLGPEAPGPLTEPMRLAGLQ